MDSHSRIRSIQLPSNSHQSNRRSRTQLPRRGPSNDEASLNQSTSTVTTLAATRSNAKSSRSSSVAKRNSASTIDSDIMLSDPGYKARSGSGSLNTTTSQQQQRGSRTSSSSIPAVSSGSQTMKKDKEKERAHSLNKHAEDALSTFSGPLAAAEFERMRKEIESLRNAMHDHKKTIKKQAKTIGELKSEVIARIAAKSEVEAQLQSMKAKQSVNDELMHNIETSLQCQICMDLLCKPFALSPCGHILCLTCLQSWFRKAPPSLDDADIEPEDPDDPNYIKYRTKSCPCCRANVNRRPAPVFLVKNILSAFQKAKAPIGTVARRSTSPFVSEEDPWEGLFPDTDEEGECYALEAYDSDGETRGSESSSTDDEGMIIEEAGDSMNEEEDDSMNEYEDDESMNEDEEVDEDEDDEDEEEGDSEPEDYIEHQWEPPCVDIRHGPVRGERLRLLRRGCTQWMSRVYRMKYSHDFGLVAHLNSLDARNIDNIPHGPTENMHRLFLGWNIHDVEPDEMFAEQGGKEFMREVLTEYELHPHHFKVVMRRYGQLDVHLLVRTDRVGRRYDTTDSEAWL